jgi:alkanesulfonate monooxygenase SsuD/methylene tetrahydromethanopterin reductase-like flavin-dependent oxidoreductase (luciferase family)
MDFGQFNLMGYRERGTPTRRILDQAVEQVKVAEQAGFAIAWFAEHHFSNYCVCPSPLMMVARLAGETARIRLGTAVVVVPLYQPARLLAEIGMADSLCGGRLVLGIGSGYQPYEFERFGEDLAVSKEKTEEFMDMVELAFTRETFRYQGKHYQLPETHISARPTSGMPEVCIAGDNPLIHRIAARRGYVPMFTGRMSGVDYLVKMRATVEDAWRTEGKDPATMPLGIQRFMCVTRSRRETLDYVDNARHQMRLASNLRRREQVVDGAMLIEQPMPGEIPIEQMAGNLLVGDCETIAERLTEEIRRARPSHMMFHFQVGGSDYASALETIERFATDIRPAVERELGPLDRVNVPRIADAA